MKLSLRNRIALYYASATGTLALIVFILLYSVIYRSVYDHLDGDLYAESRSVLDSVAVLSDRVVFASEQEWQEQEHRDVEVNPMFLQVIDSNQRIIRKSPNLGSYALRFSPSYGLKRVCFNSVLHGSSVRQLQLPLLSPHGRPLGYLIVAMPREEAEIVLLNFRNVLLLTFPLVLIFVFYFSRIIAARVVSPIERIIGFAETITSRNLDQRVEPPEHQDELFRLTTTINELLDRLKDAVLRERQFTADASHELRTPLSALKGTLEVMIRKPRSPEHYEEKIRYCITEVDRLSNLVDQLLLLARFEANQIQPSIQEVHLTDILSEVVARIRTLAKAQAVEVQISSASKGNPVVQGDRGMLEIMFQNILSNAVKYSPGGSLVNVDWSNSQGGDICVAIRDNGCGIPPEARTKIFDRFYRLDAARGSKIGGAGLGLAIVKRLADLQNLQLVVAGNQEKGTVFQVVFPGRS